jgi:hypothetical protein
MANEQPIGQIRVEVAFIEVAKDMRSLNKAQFGYYGEIVVADVQENTDRNVKDIEITKLRFPFSGRNLDDAVRTAYQSAEALGRRIAEASAEALRGLESPRPQEAVDHQDRN